MTRIRWITAIAALAILLAVAIITVAWLLRDTITTTAEKAVPGLAPTWTTNGTTNTLHTGQGPDFPATLTGWQPASEWTDTVRVLGDWTSLCNTVTCIHPYPATMNGCANQRFLIRWRTTDSQKITFAHGTVAGDIGTVADQQLTQSADTGWAELNGCGWPLWKTLDPNGIADLTATIQQWTPTA